LKEKRKIVLLQWATRAVALGPAGESGLAHLGLSARSAETGELPIPHQLATRRPNLADQRRVAREGGARELAPEVRVPIWGTGSGGAHRGGLVENWRWQAGEEVEGADSGFVERW
jgi:hypothetical protein